MTFITVLIAAIVGYLAMNILTHPTKSKVWKKLKNRQYQTKRVQVFPSIRIYIADRVIHFHHWFNFCLLLVISVFITNSILDSSFFRGFLLGGVIQGLSYSEKNGRQVIYRKIKDQVFAPTEY